MGTSSLGARKLAATFQAARKLLRCDVARPLRGAPTTVAQRGRAGHEFFAFPYLPLWVGEWGLNPPRWQSGCVWVGQLCGDSACGAGGWVRGGGVGALAPVELWVLGPLAGWLGLAVRGWVTWHDLPAGQWIGLGSGRGLGIAAPPSHRPMPREQGRKCGHGERGAVHGRSRPGRGGRWACGTR